MNLENIILSYLIANEIPTEHPITKSSVMELILFGAKESEWNKVTATRFSKKHFPSKPVGVHLKTFILKELSVFLCTNCMEVFNLEEGYVNKSRNSGVSSFCKNCHSIKMKQHYSENKDYYKNKRTVYYLRVVEQTPKWADLDKIREIYKNCPEGYHVDHILPLRGKLVSGLHVETNLQYLTIAENLQKSNKTNIGL